MNPEVQALQARLEQLERRCEQAESRYEQSERRYEQSERRYEQSERRYHHAERRLRVLAGLALGAVVGAILISPANRAALAQGYGATLQQLIEKYSDPICQDSFSAYLRW